MMLEGIGVELKDMGASMEKISYREVQSKLQKLGRNKMREKGMKRCYVLRK